ncbi:hypothetical protein [Rhodophyticola porphyridii]|uniref:hypothetical protein n=1 Tax=Rhodophyticola porphyridii TaxID=1852017 RepID=UPI0035D00CB7
MNEREMIAALEQALESAKNAELDTGYAQGYFEVGEWLLALEELEYTAEKNLEFERIYSKTFRSIRAYFDEG